MTSMVLSKNTLRKAFGCSLPSNDCHLNINTECIQRPNTAVPGKRRPFTDNPPRCEEVEIKSNDKTINKNTSDVVRPKTSYSNRRLSLTDDMVNQNNTADNSCPGRKTTLNSSPTALEDIDIVEYFNDKSIRDIFPSSNEDEIDRNTNNQNNSYNKYGHCDRKHDLHQKPNKTRSIKPSLGYDSASFSRLERIRVHNKPLSKDTSMHMLHTRNNNIRSSRGPVGTTMLQNGQYDVHVDNQIALDRKSKSLKEKTVMKTDLRRRLHSDTDIPCSQTKSSNNTICSFGTSHTRPGSKPPLQQSNFKEVESFYSSPNVLFESERAINKYNNDSRFVSRKFQPCSNTNRKTSFEYSTERPDSYHYKTNKFPRKLKPIPRRENLRGIDKET